MTRPSMPDRPPGLLAGVALAFTVSSLLLALPLYERIYASPGTLELIRLVILVQVIPTSALSVFLWFLGRIETRIASTAVWFLWMVLIAAAIASLAGLVSGQIRRDPGFLFRLLPVQVAFTVLVVLVFLPALSSVLVVVLSIRTSIAGAMRQLLIQISPVLVAVTAFFLLTNMLLGTPSRAGDLELGEGRNDSVFILVFDELGRDVLLDGDRIDGNRFPNIKMLADEGIWFSRASADYGVTCDSIPSLLTGLYVDTSEFPTEAMCRRAFVPTGESNLLAVMARHYRVSIYEDYLRDCWTGAPYTCRGLPHLLARDPVAALSSKLVPVPQVRRGVLGVPDSGHTYSLALFQELLDEVHSSNAPGRIYYFHTLLPHFPFEYGPTGELRREITPNEYFVSDRPADAATHAAYVEQVMLVDSLIGRLIDKLKAENLYSFATVVVTSDHGPRTWDRNGAGFLGEPNLATPDVPLVIRSPRHTARVSEVDYQHVDFAPTLLDVLGIEAPVEMEGVSAFSPQRPTRERVFVFGSRVWAEDPGTGEWRKVQGAPNHP